MSIIEDINSIDIQRLRAGKWWPRVGKQESSVAEVIRNMDLNIDVFAHGALVETIWSSHLARRKLCRG